MAATDRPRLLDLFCCDGGAATGYHQAGFDVTGVDIVKRPRYPFTFHQGDALQFLADHGHEYDAWHASPPCKSETVMKVLSDRQHPDLLTPTLIALRAGTDTKPWVVENVVSPSTRDKMPDAFMLCGGSFGLGTTCIDGVYRPLRRHRLFVSSVFMLSNGCSCTGEQPVGVYGNGGTSSNTGRQYQAGVKDARAVMEMPWASREGVSQAIPPAYTRFIGEQLIVAL